MNWYLKVLILYADFNGRARRREFWMFSLFNLIFSIITLFIDNALGLSFNFIGNELGAGYFNLLYHLIVFIPCLDVSVRRLHDIGKSGWMLLINLILFVGGIWLLILFVRDSISGNNEYGPNPKGL